MEYKKSILTNLTFDLNTMYLTSGISWIDKWAIQVIEWNKYTKITFRSTSIEKISSTNFSVTGIIDFHGIKKSITIPAVYDNKYLSGKFSLYIMDFNIKKPRPFNIPIDDYATVSYKVLNGDE
jgi:polyisoprenoid-binding protein YceI